MPLVVFVWVAVGIPLTNAVLKPLFRASRAPESRFKQLPGVFRLNDLRPSPVLQCVTE